MKTYHAFIIGVLTIMVFSTNAFCDSTDSDKKATNYREIGIELGYGGNFGGKEIGSRGDYKTVAFQAYYGVDLNAEFPALNSVFGNFLGYVKPSYEQTVGLAKGFEATFSVGIRYVVPITSQFKVFLGGDFGPSYVSIMRTLTPPASGFELRSEVGLGMYYFFNKNEAVTIQYNIKHDSNGRFDWPNYSYNDQYCFVGYSWYVL